MDQLTLGVVSKSRKENEHRLAIHPLHLERIDADLRARIYLETGYGERFGVSDEQLAPLVAGLRRPRASSSPVRRHPAAQAAAPRTCAELREGQVLWGWPHCVQDEEVTQLAIDRRLTLIAFEAMNHWNSRRHLQPARLPQEQRAGRVLLGAARPAARRARPATTAAGCGRS